MNKKIKINKYDVNFIEYHYITLEAENEIDAQIKAEKLLSDGKAGDTYLSMEFTDIEEVK